MQHPHKVFDILDQPPSESAWAEFSEALDQVPGSDLKGLLPELLALWPDHLRVARVQWAGSFWHRKFVLELRNVVPAMPIPAVLTGIRISKNQIGRCNWQFNPF